jgi:Natural resistance-associated macrophage protein-like
VLRWLALSLLAYVGVLAVVHVDWKAALASTVVPRLQLDRASVAALLAVFGTTVSPYLFFWQAGEAIEQQAERHDPVDRNHVAAMRLDVIAGMGSGVAVMFAIMTTAAVTLGAHGAVQVSTAQQAAQALRPLAGNLAGLLFAAGIVGTGLLAVPVLAGSTAYAIAETLGWREGLSRRVVQARAFRDRRLDPRRAGDGLPRGRPDPGAVPGGHPQRHGRSPLVVLILSIPVRREVSRIPKPSGVAASASSTRTRRPRGAGGDERLPFRPVGRAPCGRATKELTARSLGRLGGLEPIPLGSLAEPQLLRPARAPLEWAGHSLESSAVSR